AGNLIEISVREISPLLPDLALEILPASFDTIPIHRFLPNAGCGNRWLLPLIEPPRQKLVPTCPLPLACKQNLRWFPLYVCAPNFQARSSAGTRRSRTASYWRTIARPRERA